MNGCDLMQNQKSKKKNDYKNYLFKCSPIQKQMESIFTISIVFVLSSFSFSGYDVCFYSIEDDTVPMGLVSRHISNDNQMFQRWSENNMPVRQECDKKLRERGKNLCVLITEIKFSCIQKPLINTPVIILKTSQLQSFIRFSLCLLNQPTFNCKPNFTTQKNSLRNGELFVANLQTVLTQCVLACIKKSMGLKGLISNTVTLGGQSCSFFITK